MQATVGCHAFPTRQSYHSAESTRKTQHPSTASTSYLVVPDATLYPVQGHLLGALGLGRQAGVQLKASAAFTEKRAAGYLPSAGGRSQAIHSESRPALDSLRTDLRGAKLVICYPHDRFAAANFLIIGFHCLL